MRPARPVLSVIPTIRGFPDVAAIDKFAKELGEAEAAGAVRIANGKGRNGDQIAHVRLQAAARMYAFSRTSTHRRACR